MQFTQSIPPDPPICRQHTKNPYVTGTSVIGIKYKDGVLIAADTLAAYGSTKRYKSFQRVVKVGAYVWGEEPVSRVVCSVPHRQWGQFMPAEMLHCMDTRGMDAMQIAGMATLL